MIKNYTYLFQTCQFLLGQRKDIGFDEVNLAGARMSAKTYSVNTMICTLIAIAMKENKKVAVYGFRKLSSDSLQMAQELDQLLNQFGFLESQTKIQITNGTSYIKTQKGAKIRYKFYGGSFVEFGGVYKSGGVTALKGLSSCMNFDLCVHWREEANEFSIAEKQSIDMAVRGAKKEVAISSTNPDSIFQDHIQYLNSRMPFNRNKLIEFGEQIGWLKEAGIRKIFHYTNYKINTYLSFEVLNKFEELKLLDPIKYEIWGVGMPGGSETSIFARYLKPNSIINISPVYFYGGLDIGFADSPVGHPTCAILVGTNLEKTKIAVLSEYFHSNAKNYHKSTIELANDIIKFYINMSNKYLAMKNGFVCNVDYGSGGAIFIDTLNTIRNQNYTIETWLKFEAVDKSVWYTKDRIEATTIMLTTNKLIIDKSATPNLFEQMSLMEWKKPTNNINSNYKLEMLDKNDDCWDALCYAIMQLIPRIIKTTNPILVAKNTYNRITNVSGDNEKW